MSVKKEEIKINENVTVNEPKFNEKIQLNSAQTTTISMKDQIGINFNLVYKLKF